MNPAHSLEPDIVRVDLTGWWVYAADPVIGSFIAVIIITTIRGLPRKAEQTGGEPSQ